MDTLSERMIVTAITVAIAVPFMILLWWLSSRFATWLGPTRGIWLLAAMVIFPLIFIVYRIVYG